MVCHRWTLALILIFVPILATVISAFRVRLPGGSHEVKSDRRHKREDCGVSDLNLDPVIHSFKKESAKRSFDDVKKVLSEKRNIISEKLSNNEVKWKNIEDENKVDDDDDDDSDLETKTTFKNIDETKKNLDIKTKTKKVSLVLDFNDDDDDDSDVDDDDDDYDQSKLTDHKKSVVSNLKEKYEKEKKLILPPVKPQLKSVTSNIDKKNGTLSDDSKAKATDHIKQKVDISLIKTVLKESFKSKEDTVKPLKTNIKEDNKEKEQNIGSHVKDPVKLKTINKSKDAPIKESIILKPIQVKTVTKADGVKEKERPIQKFLDTEVPLTKSKEKSIQDVKTKNTLVIKKTIDTVPKELVVEKKEQAPKTESKDNNLQHLSDVLHRRNLLQSEFEDFYAFLPTFAPNFTRVHNPECRRHGQILLRQLRGSKLWALNMLDATAKIPSGLLQGNGIQLGDFDQCLAVRARVQLDTGSVVRLHGKYCLAMIDVKAEHPELEMPVHLAQSRNLFKSKLDDPGHFVPRFSTLSWGVCVPSPCSPEDVEVILRDAIKHYQYKSGISIRVKVDNHDCYTRKAASWWKEWLELPTVLTLSLYTSVVTLVVIATVQDFLATNNSDEEKPDEGMSKDVDTEEKAATEKKTTDGFLSSFSLYNTLGKLFGPATDDEIACIHGVRAIATIALLFAHKFLPIGMTPYTNRLKISEIVTSPLLSWCRAGWMFTDCFLLLSGTLTSYRKSTNDVLVFKLLSRYFRLTPALLAVVVFYAYVWDNISSGPMWGTLVTKNAELCQQSWWWNLLYVQNYFGFEDMCAPQTHHMALDFQLTILGGIIVWAIQSNIPFSGTVMALLHLFSAYSRYSSFRDHRLTLLAYQGVSVSQLYRTGYLSYTAVFHRCSPYLIGLSLGLALRNTSSISTLLSVFGWLVCGILWGLVLWAGADSGYFEYRYDVTFAALYATLAPLATALAFAWIIYAVHKNSSGFLSRALCSRPLVFVSRISYALYLIQFIVYLTNTATVRSPKEFTLTTLFDLQEVSTILISSIILTITFVIPVQSLPKISFESKADNEGDVDETKETTERSETNNENDLKPAKGQTIKEVPQRRSFLAHREVLEEIPEADVEYEIQRDTNEALEEILEEEDDDIDNEMSDREVEDLEVIEEEQGGEDEEFGPEEVHERLLPRSHSEENDQDIDEWEWTANGNERSGSQRYHYSR